MGGVRRREEVRTRPLLDLHAERLAAREGQNDLDAFRFLEFDGEALQGVGERRGGEDVDLLDIVRCRPTREAAEPQGDGANPRRAENVQSALPTRRETRDVCVRFVDPFREAERRVERARFLPSCDRDGALAHVFFQKRHTAQEVGEVEATVIAVSPVKLEGLGKVRSRFVLFAEPKRRIPEMTHLVREAEWVIGTAQDVHRLAPHTFGLVVPLEVGQDVRPEMQRVREPSGLAFEQGRGALQTTQRCLQGDTLLVSL